MTWAVVQQKTDSVASVGGGLTTTVTVDTPTIAGNKVLIVALAQTSGTPACTGVTADANSKYSGFTYNQVSLFSKDTPGGETSWTLTGFTASTDPVAWIVFELSGVATGAVDQTATSSSNAPPYMTGTTATTTSPSELAVAALGGFWVGAAPAITGWTDSFVQQGSAVNVAVPFGPGNATVAVAFLELTTTQAVSTTAGGDGSFSVGCMGTYPLAGAAPATSPQQVIVMPSVAAHRAASW